MTFLLTGRFLRRIVSIVIAALIVCFVSLILFYHVFVRQYENTIALESTAHLQEINQQITSYISESITNKWQMAYTIGETLQMVDGNDDTAIIEVLQKARARWGYTDVCVYTADGSGINADRQSERADKASELIHSVYKDKRIIDVLASTVTFAVYVDTKVEYNDSEIIAVAVKRDVGTLLDNLSIASFEGQAELYLVRQNGIIISQYLKGARQGVYNILTLFDNDEIEYFDKGHSSVAELLTLNRECIFLHKRANGQNEYVMVSPVGSGKWNLVYTVPENVLNASTQSFSMYISVMSVMMITLMLLLGFSLFTAVYKVRKKQMEQAMLSREKLFDLLTMETSFAFGLLSRSRKEPLYITANANKMLNGGILLIDTDSDVFRLTTPTDTNYPALDKLNDELSRWDGQSVFFSDYLPYNANNSFKWHSVKLYPVSSDTDEIIIIVQDVTYEYEHELALRSALSDADSANRAKTTFLSNVSHDIRTPMNAIINMTDFAIESIGAPDKLSEYLDTIKSSSAHLLDLINNVLEISRIESGNVEILSEPLDIEALLNDVVDIITPLAAAKNQEFRHSTELRHKNIRGDKLKLSQVLINLLNNSIKFTSNGGCVKFAINELGSLLAESAVLRFTVSDNGIGISPENLSTIFEPFKRSNTTVVRHTEGTGLGLSITKNYVEALGGTITVESELGKGTVFTVELPFDIADEIAAESREAPEIIAYTGKRALLCEDISFNRAIARRLLSKFGLEVEEAEDGGQAVEKFIASDIGYYSIIFMDIQMPVMDGYDATRRIRSSERPDAKTVPIIAMTANVFKEDVEKARAAGMNEHLGKPIDVRALTRAIRNALGEEK